MDECLAYFRKAVTDPQSVPPWSEWWPANAGLVEQVFPRHDFVRLKHRRLLGALQILQARGELPDTYYMPSALLTGTCELCGERTTHSGGLGGGYITCPIHGAIITYDCRPDDPDKRSA